MSIKGKKILITAGPTWVPIDSVRVISNVASGLTGMLLAKEVAAQGGRVTLILGPCGEHNLNSSIRIIRFRFFNELKRLLKRELKNTKYDMVIHSAAVSDFRPEYKLRGKLSSAKAYSLRLVPLEKLVVLTRQLARKAKLVMFKLETAVTDKTLIQRAKNEAGKISADLVVANRLNPYRAFIIDKKGYRTSVRSKKELAKKLTAILLKT